MRGKWILAALVFIPVVVWTSESSHQQKERGNAFVRMMTELQKSNDEISASNTLIKELQDEVSSLKSKMQELELHFHKRVNDLEETHREENCVRNTGYEYNKTLSLCYKNHRTKKNRKYAIQTCNSEKGILMKITSQAKFDFIQALLKKTAGSKDQYFVDGKKQNGIWVFEDGTNINKTFWANNPKYNYIIMGASGSGWYTGYWSAKRYFLCEIDVLDD